MVDTFGLEYYSFPKKALDEIRRVCKNHGKVLILAQGRGDQNWLLDFKQRSDFGFKVANFGHFNNRDWSRMLEKYNEDLNKTDGPFKGLKVIMEKRFMNGTLYYMILENVK